MKIVIAGPGAIGCLFASLLDGEDRRIVLLDKDATRACVLERNGIRLETDAGSRVTSVHATTDPGCLEQADLLLICVKAYDTENVLKSLSSRLRNSKTVVALLQNGLDSDGKLARYAGASRSVYAVTGHGATSLGVGHVAHAGSGVTRIAPVLFNQPDAALKLSALLRACGLATAYYQDCRSVIWSKLVINAGVNPVTALAGVPNGTLLQRQDLFDRALQAAMEAQQVAAAMGITLDYTEVDGELRRVCGHTAANLSSMLQDLRRGRRTEIDALNGAVAREGHRLGIPVPMNTELIAAVTNRLRIAAT